MRVRNVTLPGGERWIGVSFGAGETVLSLDESKQLAGLLAEAILVAESSFPNPSKEPAMTATPRQPIEKPIPPVTLDLYQYAEAMGWTVAVGYSHHRDPSQRQFHANVTRGYDGSPWVVADDGMHESASGHGPTPEAAIADYERRLAGRTIVFLGVRAAGDTTPMRFQVPAGLGGGSS